MKDTPIYQALVDLEGKQRIPFHMPGHKRKDINIYTDRMLYSYDITEISGYDNLHHPEGIIRDSMDWLKKTYGTEESWYLINGSTAGILASIASCCEVGDQIVVGRNCHKAVYNMIRLLHLRPIYLYPAYSEKYQMLLDIKADEQERLKEILRTTPDIKAVFLTSPTYEGVISDIRSIKDILNPYGIPLIVDEAHGAHLIFFDGPKSAISCGADIVIQSSHKTLPAPTQTALLHLCTGLVGKEKLQENLSVFQTSSPSYLLMAANEYAVAYMRNSVDKCEEYQRDIHIFRSKCAQLKQIQLLNKEDVDCFAYDEGKLVFSLSSCDMDGHAFFDRLLKDYGIELEMANMSYGIAMTSICDGEADFDALWHAISSIDEELAMKEADFNSCRHAISSIDEELAMKEKKIKLEPGYEQSPILKASNQRFSHIKQIEKVYEPWQCNTMKRKKIPLVESVGAVAAEFVQLYPPDIPLLVPGEKIQQEIVENMCYYIYNGYNVLGVQSGTIEVIDE